MTVNQILRQKGQHIISIEQTATVVQAAKLLGEKRIGAALVMQGDLLQGIISERDIIRGLSVRGEEILSETVENLMTRSVFTCHGSDSIQDIMTMMTERRIRHLPVVENDCVQGVISIGDVVKERISETEHEAEALKNYIAHA